MGLQKIQAKREELKKRVEVLAQLTKISATINAEQAKLQAEQNLVSAQMDKLNDEWHQMGLDVDKIDTRGVPEFEHYHRSLVSMLEARGRPRPLPLKPLQVALQRIRASGDPDLASKVDALDKLSDLAARLNARTAAVAAAWDALGPAEAKWHATLDKLLTKVEKVDAMDVPEFVQYKESLVAILNGRGRPRPLPTKPLQVAVDRLRKELDADFSRWLAKRAAPLPAQVKPGMILGDPATGRVYEIKSGPRKVGELTEYQTVMMQSSKPLQSLLLTSRELKQGKIKLILE